MNSLITGLTELNRETQTENGMPAKNSTGNARLDFFYSVPSQRKAKMDFKYQSFINAFNEDPTDAMRLLFWLRDIKEGSGERNSFQGIINLAAINDKFKTEHIRFIPEFGRWDDVLSLCNTPLEGNAISFYAQALRDGNSLAAKWCPRMSGKHKGVANKIRKELNLNMKNYRLLLSRMSKTVETEMCAKNWDGIEYTKVPALAMSRYTNAFMNRDEDRFFKFILDGNIKAGNLFPHDVMKQYKSIKSPKSKVLVNATWKSMPDNVVTEGEIILPLIDVSGSMSTRVSGETTAMDISISMGIYLAQRIKGAFKNKFITFESSPKFMDIGDRNFCEAVEYTRKAPWGGSTNIEAVFKLVLNAAVGNNVPKEDMPSKIVIFSDMQFNHCSRNSSLSFMDMVESSYKSAGYEVPRIIFWNLCSKDNTVNHADANSNKATLASGFSTNLMKSVFNDTYIEESLETVITQDGKIEQQVVEKVIQKTPFEIMKETISSERYKEITW